MKNMIRAAFSKHAVFLKVALVALLFFIPVTEVLAQNPQNSAADDQDKLGTKYLTGNGVKKDFKKAYENFSKAAASGHAAAELHLAQMLENGEGVRKNPKRAFHLAKHSAEQGLVEAQNHLGWMYQKGIGTRIDSQSAVSWFRRAAANGSAAAKYNLGVSYERGVGVKADPSVALRWFHDSAQSGNPSAQFMLGVLYTLGIGTQQNLAEGHTWFQHAQEPTRWSQAGQNFLKAAQCGTSFKSFEFWLRKNLSRGEAMVKSASTNDWMR
ncbi:MAG: sel1 repeat family protein [Candidatus Obscuribacterales bacterium]|nr:sel1 repeat family protein [Candidatus Obscuribacterales bacterium]